MSHQMELETQLKSIIKDTLGSINYQQSNKMKADQQEDALIPKQIHENLDQAQKKQQESSQNNQNDIIDPFNQLIKNNDVVPLLAVIDKIDIQAIVQYKPLLNRLCTMHLPLSRILADRKFKFQTDSSNRSALHEAIAADDIPAVHFCLQNRIQNIKDIFGMTPILEAIKLGRKAAFLLCLHYHYYDNQVPHMCAKYNRAWQLKVLHELGYDIINQRDSQFFTPLERAVQNYSFDCAEFLVEMGANFNPKDLQKKTDSKGIMRLVKRVKKESSAFNQSILPFIQILINLAIIYELTFFSTFQNAGYQLKVGGLLISILYIITITISLVTSQKNPQPKEGILMDLLEAPNFPPLKDICPYCLKFKQTHKEHCKKCHNCVQRLHFHNFACINIHNEIFWLLVQICWFWLILKMNSIFNNNLAVSHLHINSVYSNIFFYNATVVDYLYSNQLFAELLQFIYIKIFLIYQFCIVFQWICMLLLQRTHLEINNTQKFKRLYKIGRTQDGSYKSQEIKIMEGGFVKGLVIGLKNIVLYFFK